MEVSFRNTLIIISAIVIVGIFIHGYWTIRKQKTKDEVVKSQPRGFDGSGFDEVGVSKPKVVGNNPLHHEAVLKSHRINDAKDFHTDKPMPESVPSAVFEDKEPSFNFGELDNEIEEIPEHIKQQPTANFSSKDNENAEINEKITRQDPVVKQNDPIADQEKDSISDNLEQPIKPEPTPVYQQPVTHAKPKLAETSPAVRKSNVRRQTKSSMKRNQMEIDFADAAIEDMPSMSASKETASDTTKSTEPITNIEPQVIVLSVVMPQGETMSGAALLPTLLTLGLKYGEMNIFHRHHDNAGNGQVTFSLANMMNPGTFELDDIENFSTQGVTLFMTLPNTGDAFEVFEQMLNAAKQLAVEFRGQLLDDKRSVMTKQTEQHYKSIIREFERKSRIGSL